MVLDSVERDTVIISGNNVTWDFSNAVAYQAYDSSLFAINPTLTPFYNAPNVNYDSSNLCLHEPKGMFWGAPDDSLYSYFLSDSTSIHFIGKWSNTLTNELYYYNLTDTERYFSFPFSLNENFVDSFAGTSYDMSGSGWHPEYGRRYVIADGFGTVILPSATYTNCLKVTSYRTGYRSCLCPHPYINVKVYTWFQLNTNGPILQVEGDSSYSSQQNFLYKPKYYYNNPTWVGINESESKIDFSIYPNPVSSILNGVLKEGKISNFNLSIYNQLGQCLITKMIDGNRFEFNANDLPNGLYFGKIFIAATNEQKSFRFMVEH